MNIIGSEHTIVAFKVTLTVAIVGILTLMPLYAASKPYDYKTTEKETAALFNAGQWEKLIVVGEAALKNDTDYLALRYRLGVAHYNLERYADAVPHFERALGYHSDHATAQEYLYYSRHFSGDETGALSYLPDMAEEPRQKISDRAFAIIDNIGIGYAVSGSDNDAMLKSGTVFSLDVGQRWSPRFTTRLMYGNVNVMTDENLNETTIFQAQRFDSSIDYQTETTAHQFYVSLRYYVGAGFFVTLGRHQSNSSLKETTAVKTIRTPFSGQTLPETSTETVTDTTAYLHYAGIEFRHGGFLLRPEYAESDFLEKKQTQIGGSVGYGLHGYGVELQYQSVDDASGDVSDTRQFQTITLLFPLIKNTLDVRLTGFSGNPTVYSQNSGTVIFDSLHATRSKAGALLNFRIMNGLYTYYYYEQTKLEKIGTGDNAEKTLHMLGIHGFF